jgi:hypothetical protein
MELIKNTNGIIDIFNSHTKTKREEIILRKNVALNGTISRNGNKVELGYNETIICDTEETAKTIIREICNFLNN